MKFAQIRINKEEGSYDEYYNYEFAILSDNGYDSRTIITLDFFGEARYPLRDEDGEELDEVTENRKQWGIPKDEVKLIYEE